MRNWVMVAALAFIASVASAQQQAQPGAAEYLAGEAALKKGDTEGAIAAFEKSASAGGPVAAHFFLGQLYNRKRNWPKAAENLQKYVVAQPKVWQAHLQLGIALRSMDKDEEANKAFAQVVELKPDEPQPYYFLGQTAYARQDYEMAATRLEKYLQVKPDAPQAAEANYMLGHMAVMKASSDPAADATTAKQYMTKFLQLKPDSPLAPDAHFMLGTLVAKKVEALEPPEGKELTPEEKVKLTELYNEAKAELDKYVATVKPDSAQLPDAYYTLGSLAVRVEDDAAATAAFTKFLELRPDSPQAAEVKQILEDIKAAARNPKKK